ncbi:MAG TPA: glycosyltransferase family 2 protein [Candidatus Gastranaerophilales bacterium]|nr:glycosyltransferase family 2 protein [Candidatus Gastranaerophilales bacterium]
MKENKLISIAIATYNGEKFLREQLDSIYNQTYKNIEVIVCDDCSTDGTVKILEEYSQKYGLKYYINEKNLGLNKNFEKVLKLCNGEYIAISDQDDIWLPQKLAILMNEIGNATLIHCDSSIINQNGEILYISGKEKAKVKDLCLNSDKHTAMVSFVAGHSMIFHKNSLAYALPLPYKEDYDRWIPIVASKMNGIKYVDQPLVLHRHHQTNSSARRKFLFIYKFYMAIGKYFYRILRKAYRNLILAKRGL